MSEPDVIASQAEKLRLDSDFLKEVCSHAGGEQVHVCLTCGTCVLGCPVNKVAPDFNPRRIVRMIQLGMKEELFRDPAIWLCSSCYTCHERCPKNVCFTELLIVLRNLAVREGVMPEGYRLQREALCQFGRVYEIQDFDNNKRVKMGLSELAKSVDIKPLLGEPED